MVTNSWRMTTNLRAQYLRDQGFLVFVLDNRGSARRGLAFEGAIKHHMGDLEVQDQVDGVRWLVEQGLADPAAGGHLRLELRRLYGRHVPDARARNLQGRGGRRAGDRLGRLRHALHRALHGHAAVEPGRRTETSRSCSTPASLPGG